MAFINEYNPRPFQEPRDVKMRKVQCVAGACLATERCSSRSLPAVLAAAAAASAVRAQAAAAASISCCSSAPLPAAHHTHITLTPLLCNKDYITHSSKNVSHSNQKS